MNKKERIIPNPNKISDKEMEFLHSSSSSVVLKGKNQSEIDIASKEKFKGYMISMPEFFVKELNSYLKSNPAEGNKSSFIVRIVAEYIKSKNTYSR